jgi:hypothetical protein
MVSTYQGHTIFSIFQFCPLVYDQILQQLKNRNFLDTVDFFKQRTQDVFLRRLHKTLFTPTILTTTKDEEDKKKVELKSYKD